MQTKERVSWQQRSFRYCVAFCLLIATVSFTSFNCFADELDERVSQLRNAKDVRVRVQAALSLGASAQKRAVVPLCQALNDKNRTVRLATATALARLKLGGKGCLKRRLNKESDKRVLAALERALKKVSSQKAIVEPAIGQATIAYISIQALANPKKLNANFRQAMVKIALADRRIAFAPVGEKAGALKAKLKKHPQVKGVLIVPRVAKPVYAKNQLKVKVSFAVFSMPERSLKGEFTQRVAMGGISKPSASAEKELVVAAAESGMKKFLQNLRAFSN